MVVINTRRINKTLKNIMLHDCGRAHAVILSANLDERIGTQSLSHPFPLVAIVGSDGMPYERVNFSVVLLMLTKP